MMDGSRKVSLRNRQFVRKIDVPMPVTASGVKPSQFYDAQQADVPDVQPQGSDSGVVGQGGHGQLSESFSRTDSSETDGGILVDGNQNGVEVEEHDRSVTDDAVDEPPVVRSKRARKPNSKYDPAVYDLDSVEIRGIPLSGKKNGWKGVYWPQ